MIIKGFDKIKEFNTINKITSIVTTQLDLEIGQAVYGHYIGSIKKTLESKQGNKYSQNIIIISSFADKKHYRIYSTFDLDDKIMLVKTGQYIGICRFKDNDKGYKNLVLMVHTTDKAKLEDDYTVVIEENKYDDIPF